MSTEGLFGSIASVTQRFKSSTIVSTLATPAVNSSRGASGWAAVKALCGQGHYSQCVAVKKNTSPGIVALIKMYFAINVNTAKLAPPRELAARGRSRTYAEALPFSGWFV